MHIQAPGGSYLTPSFEHASVGDAMRPWVLTCTPETPLVTAAQRMAGEHVHALIVLAARPSGRAYPAHPNRRTESRHDDDVDFSTLGNGARPAPRPA